MNINQLSYIILESKNKLDISKSTYGFYNYDYEKQLLLLSIIKSVIDESEWYELEEPYILSLKIVSSKLIRNNKYFVFDVPTNDIYSNNNTSQTQFTYDQII
jgi:hypothetical protein